jgi:hypothetical protein
LGKHKLLLTLRYLVYCGIFVFVLLIGLIAAVKVSPEFGANGADALRNVLGTRLVAGLETAMYTLQDQLLKLEYGLGLAKQVEPWSTTDTLPQDTPFSTKAGIQASSNLPPTNPLASSSTVRNPKSTPQPGMVNQPTCTTTVVPETLTPCPTVEPPWAPPELKPLAIAAGEGVWQPYIRDPQGNVIGYRAFLHPDPERPYAVMAIVAMEAKSIRLNYMAGFDDPYAKKGIRRFTGCIPPQDAKPGILAAAFNGGFKFIHGNFGSMVDGFVTVPPRDGLGTVVTTSNGRIQIGKWGKDFKNSADYVDLRQNGPLVVEEGHATDQVNDASLWGYTLDGQTVTPRSGLGISQDGRTLYYFAGTYITINKLATAMLATQVWNGIQLDINNYWVYFDTFRVKNGQLQPDVLNKQVMNVQTYRYLQPFSKDFFYVTFASTDSLEVHTK